MVTFLASLGGLKKKWQDPRGLVWQCGAVAVHDCPLNCQSGGSRRLASTFSQVGSVPMSAKGICWWQINGSPTHHGKDTVTASPLVILFFLCRSLHPTVWTHPEFQFRATVFMSMATRLSDLGYQKPGTNIQKEGHTLTPPSGWNGPEDPEAFGSTPSQSPSQSPARKPNCHETQYCLEIQVISTKDGRAAPPPSHAWQAPIMEDMLRDCKAGLTEAIVTSPGQAILFYRQQSLGERPSLGKAWDAMFTLSGTVSWVGKWAQLSAKPASLGDGWWLIAQAITEGHIKPRGSSHPCSIPPASTPFNFHNQDLSPWPASIPVVAEWWEVPRLSPHPAHQGQGQLLRQGQDWDQRQWELWVAHPSHLCSPQTMGLKVTKVQCQLPHQWHQCQRDQEVLGIHAMGNSAVGKPGAIWR